MEDSEVSGVEVVMQTFSCPKCGKDSSCDLSGMFRKRQSMAFAVSCTGCGQIMPGAFNAHKGTVVFGRGAAIRAWLREGIRIIAGGVAILCGSVLLGAYAWAMGGHWFLGLAGFVIGIFFWHEVVSLALWRFETKRAAR